MAHYPKLKKNLGLIGASCLIVWALFILGMQLYVFGFYSNQYHEGTGNRNWADAYTGMVLANSAAGIFFGLYYVVMFTDKPTTKMLLWGMILAVIGAFASSGSTVLAALEADWVLVSANADSTHPCRYSNVSQEIPTYPSELICTNWFALEVTVAVLSGLAFSEYIFIGVVIFLGMSAAKSFMDHLDDLQSPLDKSADSVIPQARIGTTTTTSNNNNNNNNNPQSRAGQDGPYNAFNYSPPPSAKSAPTGQQSYDDLNPQYGYHLQQLSLQQQHQQQQQQQQPKPPAAAPVAYHQPVREAPSIPSSANAAPMNRGRLQVLHNQRQRPPAPPVPAKPNNSNLYRY